MSVFNQGTKSAFSNFAR